jgi:lipooligosaccharide transport system ATP-binding protein
MSVVSGTHIVKRFGAVTAVNDLSFAVDAGTCFGFLGPNGAGKTTLLKILYGRCRPDLRPDTHIQVMGYDPLQNELAVKALSGVVSQDNNLDEELNVIQNLRIYARFYGLSPHFAHHRIDELLAFMELTEKKNAKIKELSGGMKRRLVIARAMLNRPALLILDEPTTGLDPQVRHLIWDRLRQLKTSGTTILLTTHYMEEAFQLCDKLLIMHEGRKITEGRPRELIEQTIEAYVLELVDAQAIASVQNQTLPAQVRSDTGGGILRLYSHDLDALKLITQQLSGGESHLRQATLEDVFLKITGSSLNVHQ